MEALYTLNSPPVASLNLGFREDGSRHATCGSSAELLAQEKRFNVVV